MSEPRSKQKPTFAGLLLLILFNFLLFAVLVELVCLVFVHLPSWHSSRPTYRVNYDSFWADINPDFGVWHRPNGHFLHQGGCFNVEYTTNSYGARDRERSVHSDKPRTVVLGDSFVEGLGLPDKDRLTNILERDTGREYLNFGTGGDFGPLQYAILYRTLASKFGHNTVLVAVLPDNDFRDMDPQWGAEYHSDRYRPYYDKNFNVYYTNQVKPQDGQTLAARTEAVLRAYLASYHVGQWLYSYAHYRKQSAAPYSGYNDYTDVDWQRLVHALDDIHASAEKDHAEMAVILIPRPQDFERGTDKLGAQLSGWAQQNDVALKDLLPAMKADADGNFSQYFLPCDGHWTALGSATAAKILEPWLAQLPQAAATASQQ